MQPVWPRVNVSPQEHFLPQPKTPRRHAKNRCWSSAGAESTASQSISGIRVPIVVMKSSLGGLGPSSIIFLCFSILSSLVKSGRTPGVNGGGPAIRWSKVVKQGGGLRKRLISCPCRGVFCVRDEVGYHALRSSTALKGLSSLMQRRC